MNVKYNVLIDTATYYTIYYIYKFRDYEIHKEFDILIIFFLNSLRPSYNLNAYEKSLELLDEVNDRNTNSRIICIKKININ